MQAIGRMKSIETMERITRQRLCDNFDEILDRVDKEDIGFVILNDEGKDGYVLCPARWFQINFSDDLGCIINSACVIWKKRKEMQVPMKMIPLEKQSKREQRKFHADKRGSWNGIKPTTRIVESRKVYDRNRIRQADRRNACE